MWLIPPSLHVPDCSPCAVVSACSTPPSNSPGIMSLGSGHEFWVTLSGKPLRRPSSWPGWKNRAWSQRLFSAATSEAWTPDLCGGGAASLPLDYPASLTAVPENNAALKTPGAGAVATDRSRTRCASSGNARPPWSASRMSLNGSLKGRSVNLVTRYRLWVTRSKTRSLFVRQTWAQAIAVNGSSSWPTVRANESTGKWQRDQGMRGAERLTLNGRACLWPTVRSNAGTGADASKRDGGPTLRTLVREWPPPNAVDCENSGGPGFRATLTRVVKGWPTPAARDGQAGANTLEGLNKRTAQRFGVQLPNFVTHCLPLVLSAPPGPALSENPPTLPRRLNPAFVCWLMGWPWHWTRAEPTSFGAEATASWWRRQQQLLCIFSNN